MEVGERWLRSECNYNLLCALIFQAANNAKFQNRIRESELPNKALITDLNNDISNLKKENNTLVTRLEDLRKAVRKFSSQLESNRVQITDCCI